MFVKISAEAVDIVLVQVYMPTTNHDNDEIEKLYEEIREILPQEGRSQVNTIVIGTSTASWEKDLQIRW
jgi:hypothetical protein